MFGIYSKLTIKTSHRIHSRRYGVVIVNLEQMLYIVFVFQLLTLNKYMPASKPLTLPFNSCERGVPPAKTKKKHIFRLWVKSYAQFAPENLLFV